MNGLKETPGEDQKENLSSKTSSVKEGPTLPTLIEAMSPKKRYRGCDTEDYIEYQLRSGQPAFHDDAPKVRILRQNTLRLAKLEKSIKPHGLSTDAHQHDDAPMRKDFPPVFGTQITSLDNLYVERKNTIRQMYFVLPDKRSLCYSTDGDQTGTPVLAFHGGCECKFRFMQKEAIPDVYLVAIDRPGYGGSSPVSGKYTFETAVQDIEQLADHLQLKEFVVLGHGIGAAWAQQLAAALPHRVRGAILWSSMADPLHPKAKGDLRQALCYAEGVHYYNTGLHCPVSRGAPHFMRGATAAVAKDDFGALCLFKEKEKGFSAFEKFAADAFWVSAMVDSWKTSRNRTSILHDISLNYKSSPWPYNAEDINCPVFLFHGAGDANAKCSTVTNFLKEVIPHAQVEIIDDCGHVCSFGPDFDTRKRIQQAIAAMPPLA